MCLHDNIVQYTEAGTAGTEIVAGQCQLGSIATGLSISLYYQSLTKAHATILQVCPIEILHPPVLVWLRSIDALQDELACPMACTALLTLLGGLLQEQCSACLWHALQAPAALAVVFCRHLCDGSAWFCQVSSKLLMLHRRPAQCPPQAQGQMCWQTWRGIPEHPHQWSGPALQILHTALSTSVNPVFGRVTGPESSDSACRHVRGHCWQDMH